ncbi:MAG: hypothetical protein M3R36_01640 [Bacteroidota bacterium]|nr:hypothetical protein [Bacteroidota bacterium]
MAKIIFHIDSNHIISEDIFDINTRKFKNAGSCTLDFNGRNLSSGIYFYALFVNGFTDIKRMILLK